MARVRKLALQEAMVVMASAVATASAAKAAAQAAGAVMVLGQIGQSELFLRVVHIRVGLAKFREETVDDVESF